MEESLEEFLKRDMNEQIEDLFFSNYMEEGQAIPTIKVKNIKQWNSGTLYSIFLKNVK